MCPAKRCKDDAVVAQLGYCENCFFWAVSRPEMRCTMGDCHRYPPVVQDAHHSLWPRTSHKAWCGEWIPA